MDMTDKEFITEVERYYCKQQRSKWQSLLCGFGLMALTLFGREWLVGIDEELPTVFSMSAGLSFAFFLINYWGTPADKLLGEAVEILTKYRKFRG
ncbi:hypothetical protein HR45_00795 [Shewanella mangrovi]|uniref:Holin n=1 Tax=Shewanella mangrovi TaxID=1515746 RepID=A0A094LUS4_9GAMM|nr:hypothetical protein [Shewanella mangrovi]KFZ38973.1 hypothetical protein HR45_00795 [Shewanella mangrovi]